MMQRGPITAGELLAELEQDPAYVARQQDILARLQQSSDRYVEAATGVIADLAAAGFDVQKVSELARPGVGDGRALPALLAWLPRVAYRPLKLDIIASLGSPWARPEAARPLVAEFHRVDVATDPPDGLRWSIGDALERVADESVLDDLVQIATDARHGRARSLIVLSLARMKKARHRVVPVLLGLLDDDDVAPYAIMALGRLKAGEARPRIEQFTGHPENWVRKEARKALAKIPGDQ